MMNYSEITTEIAFIVENNFQDIKRRIYWFVQCQIRLSGKFNNSYHHLKEGLRMQLQISCLLRISSV